MAEAAQIRVTGRFRNFLSRAGNFVDHHISSEDHLIAHLFFWTNFVNRIRRPLVIAITGSVGKSTTTELVRAALEHPQAKATVGLIRSTVNNMNNYPGLPLTFLGYRRFYKTRIERIWLMLTLPLRSLWLASLASFPGVLVLEYGTDRTGYLKKLVRLMPPDIGIVTAVGPAHLAGLGSVEGVAREKATVPSAVPPDGLVILGEGHDYVDLIASMCRAPVVRCSGRGVQLAAEIARVIGKRFSIPDHAIEEAIRGAKPPERRLHCIDLDGFTAIDDTYNANPLSMQLAFDALNEIARTKTCRRVAVLGTMAELGDYGPELHLEVGRLAQQHADWIVGVGTLAKLYQPDIWYPDSDTCAREIHQFAQRNDVILVKGSASAELHKVVDGLKSFRVADLIPAEGDPA